MLFRSTEDRQVDLNEIIAYAPMLKSSAEISVVLILLIIFVDHQAFWHFPFLICLVPTLLYGGLECWRNYAIYTSNENQISKGLYLNSLINWISFFLLQVFYLYLYSLPS